MGEPGSGDGRESLFPLRERSAFRLQGVNINHPGERDRLNGAQSEVWLGIARASGSILEVPLTEDELVRLIAKASAHLETLYKRRTSE